MQVALDQTDLKSLISGYLVRLAQLANLIIPYLPLTDFHQMTENLHHCMYIAFFLAMPNLTFIIQLSSNMDHL